MSEMTSHERFQRMYEHRDADRVPIIDSPWGATVERWQREGMPTGVSYVDFFGLDHVSGISADNSPRFPQTTIEETEEYRIYTTRWGATQKDWKHAASTPEFLDFTIVDPDSWAKAKERIQPTRDRINWDGLKRNCAAWRERGDWIEGGLWFGFDVIHSWMIGTERMLFAMVENPEWVMDMIGHLLDTHLQLLDLVWDEGYTFDSVRWPDDMGYKHNTFFSLAMYREIVLPFQRKAIEWAHRKGVRAHLHSCGDINPFVPDLVAAGLDALNPLEVKAGMDPRPPEEDLRRPFGPARRHQRRPLGPARRDPRRNGARPSHAQGERWLYLQLRPLRPLQRQPGRLPGNHCLGQAVGLVRVEVPVWRGTAEREASRRPPRSGRNEARGLKGAGGSGSFGACICPSSHAQVGTAEPQN